MLRSTHTQTYTYDRMQLLYANPLSVLSLFPKTCKKMHTDSLIISTAIIRTVVQNTTSAETQEVVFAVRGNTS